MKIGNLVSYGTKWYSGPKRVGLIVDENRKYPASSMGENFFFVVWNNDEPEWEEEDDLVIIG
jgi:hypothetical protein